ncbi:glycerate kinase [Planomicrobium okeanokoites]|uniref:glycerate kinase n=1 Tax=Planomicrobium okeanokoites TaxID=244 RepID=UPI00248FCC22|nr:glycerate kinase [Planomicrobium okeanokoites]
MKIIIAPDSFKSSMTSLEAALAIKRGILDVDPLAETILLPMADGGEGTVEAILSVSGGERISCQVQDPLGRKIEAAYGWIVEEKAAVIETAAASGLPLLFPEELDPDKASSFGTGQLIKDALDRGAEKIILGLGGSATVDAGTGLFQALGVKFFDENNRELETVGGRVDLITSMDATGLEPSLTAVQIIVASDVINPLLGKDGAIAVFGPQKGVKQQHMSRYEKGMRQFSALAANTMSHDKSAEPGSGAAGGIGFLLKTLLDVEFMSGFELIVERTQLEKQLDGADLVLTGEGRIDGQSVFGKVPVGIGRLARSHNIPVIAFAGSIGSGIENLEKEGILEIMPIISGPMELQEALLDGESLLYKAAKRLMNILKLGKVIADDK